MPGMKKIILLCIISALSVTASAQTTGEIKMEMGRTFEESDKAMNAAYQKLLGILNEEGKKRLRAAQRAWIAYRDAQAEFAAHPFAGGSAEGIEYSGSLNLLTHERTKKLLEDYKHFKDL